MFVFDLGTREWMINNHYDCNSTSTARWKTEPTCSYHNNHAMCTAGQTIAVLANCSNWGPCSSLQVADLLGDFVCAALSEAGRWEMADALYVALSNLLARCVGQDSGLLSHAAAVREVTSAFLERIAATDPETAANLRAYRLDRIVKHNVPRDLEALFATGATVSCSGDCDSASRATLALSVLPLTCSVAATASSTQQAMLLQAVGSMPVPGTCPCSEFVSIPLMRLLRWHPQALEPAAGTAGQALALVAPARAPHSRSVTIASIKAGHSNQTDHNDVTGMSLRVRYDAAERFVGVSSHPKGASKQRPLRKNDQHGLIRKTDAGLAAFSIAAAKWANVCSPFPVCSNWWSTPSASTSVFDSSFAYKRNGKVSLQRAAELGYHGGASDHYLVFVACAEPAM
jgi:hypothetical protein